VPGALADPQAQARGAVVDYQHPRFGSVRQIASPLRHDAAPPPIARGPRRGEHQQSVLADLCSYSPARVATLRASGAFGAQENRESVAAGQDDARAGGCSRPSDGFPTPSVSRPIERNSAAQ
jgi:hypothetical protein